MYDRAGRVKKLEHAPGPTDEERIEKLKDYLNGKRDLGNKPEAGFTEARTYLER